MKKCCICGGVFFGKGIESQGIILPVCGRPCFDRKVEKIAELLAGKDIQEPFHVEPEPLQGLVLAAVPA